MMVLGWWKYVNSTKINTRDNEKVKMIQKSSKIALSGHKSYTNQRRNPLEFFVGKHVF